MSPSNLNNKPGLACFLFIVQIAITYSCSYRHQHEQYAYPEFRPGILKETKFGISITDPYRLLENLDDPMVKEWFQKENSFTNSILENISGKDAIKKELTELVNAPHYWSDIPRPSEKFVFYNRNNTNDQQTKLVCLNTMTGLESVLFSIDTFKSKTTSCKLDFFEPSLDGRYIALGISSHGDENSSIYILDTEHKVLLPDKIERAMGGNPNWIPGANAFFYQQFKELKTKKDSISKYENAKVKIHYLGTLPQNDREVFSDSNNPELKIDKIDFPLIYVFPESEYVIGVINHGSEPYSSLYSTSLKRLLTPNLTPTWSKICDSQQRVTHFGLHKNLLYVLSHEVNPDGRIEKCPISHPEKKEIIFSQENQVIQSMIESKDAIFFSTTSGPASHLWKMDFRTGLVREIKIPYNGDITIQPIYEVPPLYINSSDLYFLISSWNVESVLFHYSPLLDTVNPAFPYANEIITKHSNLTVKEMQISSYDGTLVPLTIIYDHSIKLNGQNPTILNAYGAYGVSISPYFSPFSLPWFKRGGIYAIAHVRGGGEKGDSWYKGGFKTTKPNSWKDMIACAEYLIAEKYTCSAKLAAEGASAGGITVGRAITERPDLFKAAFITAGELNLIRSENSFNTINTAEFGSSGDSLGFKNLLEMDTYQHIKENVHYPSILFTTALNDARVAPWEPGKVVAKSQHVCANDNNVILLQVDSLGHFGTMPFRSISEYCFLFWQLGVPGFGSPRNNQK
jgi:prolyl oligopeptidase